MYKRRDWLFTHGADGGGDETSSSDSSSSESAGGSESTTSGSDDNEQLTSQQPSGRDDETTSSDADSDDRPAAAATRKRPAAAAQSESEESSDSESESEERREPLWASNPIFESDGDDEGAMIGRLEDLSEDDFSGGSEDEREAEKEAQLVMQLESWAGTDGEGVKGKPLKCILCDGSLVLNSRVLKQHMESKKHIKNLEVVAKDGHTDLALHEVFCYAEDFDAAAKEEEAETYQERMERVDAALKKAQEGAAAAKDAAVKSNKDVKRRAARQKKKGKEVRKRPGKRQRLAMKESKAAEGNIGEKKSKKNSMAK